MKPPPPSTFPQLPRSPLLPLAFDAIHIDAEHCERILAGAYLGNTRRRAVGTAILELAAAGHHDEPAADRIQRGRPRNDTNEHFIEAKGPDQTHRIGLQ